MVLQLGGSDPEQLAEAVRLSRPWGASTPNVVSVGHKGGLKGLIKLLKLVKNWLCVVF